MPTGVFAFSDRAASSSAPLINEPVDAALRGLATFWGRNPRYGLLRAGRDLVGEAENLVFATTVNASEISDEEKFSENQELNFKPMTVDPLYGVVGAALVLLLADIAFGGQIRAFFASMKKAADKREKEKSGTRSDSRSTSTPSPAEFSEASAKASVHSETSAEVQAAEEAEEEWAYFKKTKMRFLLLSMTLGFSSEFLLWMLAPFFPSEGLRRGVSTELVGLVFACHPIALGFSAQLVPLLMRTIDPFVLLQRTLMLQVRAAAAASAARRCCCRRLRWM